MATFYEILHLSPTASTTEAEAAIETEYNKIRRLTTHYDANIVNQANQALLILEKARETLLNPAARAEYDASLGIGIGGLADPSMQGAPAAPTTAPVQQTLRGYYQQPVQPQLRLDEAWICPQCQQPNPKGTLYCQNCRQVVGRICPNCHVSYEAKANFCPSCSMSFDAANRQIELSSELSKKRTDRISLQSQGVPGVASQSLLMEYTSAGSAAWTVFTAVVAGHYLLATIVRLILSLFSRELVHQQSVITILNIFSTINGLLRWGIWVGVLGLAIYLIRKQKVQFSLPPIGGYAILSLLALAFSGTNLTEQVLNRRGNAWLVFPALVCVVLIALGWFLLRQYQGEQLTTNPKLPFLPKLQPLVNGLFGFYQKNLVATVGIGVALSLFTLFFSATSSIISLLTAISGFAMVGILGILAFRAHALLDFQRTSELKAKEIRSNNLALIDAEIASLEQQISDLKALPSGKHG